MAEDIKKKAVQQRVKKPEWKKFLSHTWVVKNIPFFLFVSMLAVLYIYNGHYADKLLRKISTTEKHLKELDYEFKTLKSEVIFRSKASELVRAVESMGLIELTKPPALLGSLSGTGNE